MLSILAFSQLLQTKKKGKKKKSSTDVSFRVPTLSLGIAHTRREEQKGSTSTAHQPSRKAVALAKKILEGQKCHSTTVSSAAVSKKKAKARGQGVKFSMPTLGVDTKNRQRKGFDSEEKDQVVTEEVIKYAGKEYRYE